MISKIYSSCVLGVNAYEVTAEVDIGSGLPHFGIVGLPDPAIRESRDRIKSAIKNSGFSFPSTKIIVNLHTGFPTKIEFHKKQQPPHKMWDLLRRLRALLRALYHTNH